MPTGAHARNDTVLAAARGVTPPEIRSLDAIHLATAARLRDDLGWFLAYDTRLVDPAASHGWKVASPS